MNVGEQWLREWVDIDHDVEWIAEKLTLAGLEVENVVSADPGFSGVVAARIASLAEHPASQRLRICQLEIGAGQRCQVVCGAANAREGLYVALAKIGATLPGGNKITARELGGVNSEGMLCSAKELGLTEDAGGVLELSDQVAPGDGLETLLSIEGHIIELSLTPNRGDCLSVSGIARELSLLDGCRRVETDNAQPKVQGKVQGAEIDNTLDREVVVDAPDACPRYIGRVVEGVDAAAPTPLWMTEKLRCCGVRSINPVVDIANFVMLELGQPMHAFDNDRLHGAVRVRHACPGEKLKLLSGEMREIYDGTLVIADDEEVLALAGIMGGAESAVSAATKNVFLESAFFRPQAVLGKARQYGLHTDASHRFERGVDFQITREAMERATRLLLDICGGRAGPLIEKKHDEHLPLRPAIELRRKQIKRLLGFLPSDQEIERILTLLDVQIRSNDEGWSALAPSFRFDIEIEVDLIEEIARVHGYDNIGAQAPVVRLGIHRDHRLHARTASLRRLLVNRGYQEVITYSFVAPEAQEILCPGTERLRLANPISPQLSEMRSSILPGLVGALCYNLKRQRKSLRLFETGLIFQKDRELAQELAVAGLMMGDADEAHWDAATRVSDFFDLKRDVEALHKCVAGGAEPEFKATSHAALAPDQAAKIICGGREVGYIGALHPAALKELGLSQEVFVFEVEIDRIPYPPAVEYREISKFPSVRRDLALVIDEDLRVADIMDKIKESAPDILDKLDLFDLYQGKNIESGKKSIALSLIFRRTSRTLTGNEVELTMEKILNKLQEECGATLRV